MLSLALCCHWDEIPGPGQGWHRRGLCAIFEDVFPTLMFIKNAVLALQIFCMMDKWMCGRKLAYVRTDKWTSSAFLCSFVLMSFYLSLCALVSIVLSLRWDPWSSPGMTVSVALCCCFVDVHILKTEEHKNKRGHWKSNVHSSGLDVPLLFQCICIIDAECSTLFVEKEQNKRVYSLLFRSLRLRWMCA